MGKRDKGQAAARAHAGRATIRNITGMGNQVRLPELKPHAQPTTDSEPDAIDNKSDGECGYTGGVNCDFYSDGEEGDWSDNDDLEQLDEMEGEELENNKDDCCNKRILECQDDFQQQKSLVQETIEAAGHLCIFLPKFHCELNYIEFFWGVVKKYLCNNCDYTFDALKRNLLQALHSVWLNTFWLWEQRMY